MNCYICDNNNWHKLVGYHTKIMMQVCKSCGNLCHEIEPQNEEKLLEFYRKDYRKMPNHSNLITTSNKLQYIMPFLEDYLKDKKGLMVGEVGAATGYFLNAMRRLGHKVTGSEYTITFRRMAQHFYGIPLTEELDNRQKYDLIHIYHVLEHMTEPDKKMMKYREMLVDGGVIHVATPNWLKKLHNEDLTTMNPLEGSQTLFEHHYHKNHINLFSTTQLQNVFKKAGFSIVKDNFTNYGQTYLIRPAEPAPIEPEDWQEVVDILNRQRTALDHYAKQEFDKAIKVYENFPEAHILLIFKVYGKDPNRQEDMIKNLPKSVKDDPQVLNAVGSWLAQYDRFTEAEAVFKKAFQLRPSINHIFKLADIYMRSGRHRESMQLFMKAAELHPYKWQECYDLVLWNACQLPTWDEEARQQLKEVLLNKALEEKSVEIKLPDPQQAPKPPELAQEQPKPVEQVEGPKCLKNCS